MPVPDVAGEALLARLERLTGGREVLLRDAGERHVRRDEPDVLYVVAHRPVRERTGKHFPGEGGDRLPPDQAPATAGHPHGIGVEQGEEPVDVFGALGAFELGDTGEQGVDVGGGRIGRSERRCHRSAVNFIKCT
jgi:hypothetical protein